MNKLFVLLLILMGSTVSYSQLIRYTPCSNCPTTRESMPVPAGGYYLYGNPANMTANNVASDFGRRIDTEPISRWHMGIDLSPSGGDADAGDEFFAAEPGTVTRLKGEGYKYLFIRGTHRYGYGHIFFDGLPGAGGMRSGNFFLKAMNSPYEEYYAIIYVHYATGIFQAFSERGTGTVTHPLINNNQPINVTNVVSSIYTPLAPIGDSGGKVDRDDFDAHVHLYGFQNDPVDADVGSGYPSAFNATLFRNAKNPLEFLTYTSPNYTITHPTTTIIYPGNQRSSFKVRAAIPGTGQGPYASVMDVESLELFLKKASASSTEYKLYKGPVLESKIVYGGRIGSTRYPSVGFPAHNTGASSIDLARGIDNGVDMIGNATRTGVHPSAYSTGGQPYDDFYFSDFYSRIHKDDNFGGTNATYATHNDHARYPDGQYEYYVKLTKASGASQDGPTETLTIDNFKPYIKEVIIRAQAEWGPMVYRGRWLWNGSQLVLHRETFADLPPGQQAWIKVIASEPIPLEVPLAYQLGINIPAVDGTTYRSMTPISGTDNQEFTITYNSFIGNGSKPINFNANGLERMNVSPKTVPIRQANNVWLPAADAGVDQNHYFNTGPSTCTPPPGGRTMEGECLIASFDSDIREALPGMPVQFTSYSTGTVPVTYSWSFGTGATPATANTAGPHTVTYSSAGNKTVSLTVTDVTGSITSTKSNYISVINNPSAIDFSASRTNAMVPAVINFTSSFSGAVNSYSWSFPGGTPSTSTAQNPSVTYSGTGTYDVTLTINGVSQKFKPGYITITPAPPLVASLTHCDNFYYQNCNTNYTNRQLIFFKADLTGGVMPYQYSWDFGDGQIISSVWGSNEASNSFDDPGTFTVTVTITDFLGTSTTASTTVSLVTLFPYLDVGLTISDTYVTSSDAPVIFTDNSQTNVDLSNAEFYWDFGPGAYPRFAYTKGPHSVCYDNFVPSKPIYYRVFEPSYNLYDFAYGTVNVASGNVSQCADYYPQYRPVPGSASAGVSGTCLYTTLSGIPNGDLEDVNCTVVDDPQDCPFSLVDPCFEGTVYSSHGDPSLKSFGNNYSIRLWAQSIVDINNITGGTRVKSEGIFYQHPRNFQTGVKYTFTFFARIADEDLIRCGSSCPGKVHSIDHLKISLTSGLEPTFDCQPDDGSIYLLPNYELSRFTLGSFDYTLNHNDWRCYEVYFYAPNGNFNQIWIYPEMELSLVPVSTQYQTGDRMSWMAIDNLSLRSASPESQCPAELIVQHATSGNTIVADQRVTTMGSVIITSGETKTYKAGETITLAPGFKASLGSTFTATEGICAEPGGRIRIDIPLVDLYRQNRSDEPRTYDRKVEPRLYSEPEDIIMLFPNPARDRVTIQLKDQLNQQFKLTVYNAMGMVVYEDFMRLGKTLDISLFAKGVYVVKIDMGVNTIIRQFVKH